MSLADIIGGVIPVISNTPPLAIVSQGVRDSDKIALGAGYGSGYIDQYATLKVLDLNTLKYDVLFNRGGQPVAEIDFLLLQTVSEAYIERMSPMYTLGQSLMFSSGRHARQFAYQGILLVNKSDGNYRAAFQQLYETKLRASKMVQDDPKVAVLRYRDQVRVGYITSLETQIDARVENQINVVFQMFVVNEEAISG